jgi:hypothetical protein
MVRESYLGSVLADADRRFRYRSGVASLLGQPDAIGPHPVPLRLPRGGFPYVGLHEATARFTGAAASSSQVWEPPADVTDWPDHAFWSSPGHRGGGRDAMMTDPDESFADIDENVWPSAQVNRPAESTATVVPSNAIIPGVHETPARPSSPAGRSTSVHLPTASAAQPRPDLLSEPDGAATEPNAFAPPPSTHTAVVSHAWVPIAPAAQPSRWSDAPAPPDPPIPSDAAASADDPAPAVDPHRRPKLTTATVAATDAAPQERAETALPVRTSVTASRVTDASALEPPPTQPVVPSRAPLPPPSETLSIRPAGEDPYGGVPAFWVRRHLRARHMKVLR